MMDWIHAVSGGSLIGLSATLMLIGNGRIAGVSGIYFRALEEGFSRRFLWRHFFIAGLVVGGFVVYAFDPSFFRNESGRGLGYIIAAGFLVGFGTKLGSGCTSGHGVCGLSRLSTRSLVATGAFMIAGAITVFTINHLIEG